MEEKVEEKVGKTEHLSVEEIIQFVSIRELNDETYKIAKRVGDHIKHCSKCHDQVSAFKLLDNKFEEMFEERRKEELAKTKDTVTPEDIAGADKDADLTKTDYEKADGVITDITEDKSKDENKGGDEIQ